MNTLNQPTTEPFLGGLGDKPAYRSVLPEIVLVLIAALVQYFAFVVSPLVSFWLVGAALNVLAVIMTLCVGLLIQFRALSPGLQEARLKRIAYRNFWILCSVIFVWAIVVLVKT